MTNQQQREALHRKIWAIANDVRGAVDGWDFKQFVLGALFYRFISENFTAYIEAGDESVDYAAMSDGAIPDAVKADAIKTKGYFIGPSQLFANVVANANSNESLNTDLAAIFKEIEGSANGHPSEEDIKGLFSDFDTTSNRLGSTVKDKNARLAKVPEPSTPFGHSRDSTHSTPKPSAPRSSAPTLPSNATPSRRLAKRQLTNNCSTTARPSPTPTCTCAWLRSSS